MSYSVLHISDLHYSKRNAEQRNFLATKFFEDLRITIDGHGKPNTIVFSGDIVNNPDEDDVYLYAVDNFFEKLFEISGVSASSLILCPGNHDVSRVALKRHLPTFDALRKNLGNSEVIDRYYQHNGLTEYAMDLSRRFFEFCEYIDIKWENPFFRISKIGGSQFVAINSAFSCSPSGSVDDRGKLVYPVGALEDAISRLDGGHSLGFVNHFPLTDLEEGNFRIVEPRIRSTADFVFYGHVHNANPITQLSADRGVIYLQSGALFAQNDYFKGYSYTSIEGEHSFSLYRSYYDQRAVFDVATNVAKEGMYYPTAASKAFWFRQTKRFSPEDLFSHLEGPVRDYYFATFNSGILGTELYPTYVFPTFGEVDLSKPTDGGQSSELHRGEEDFRDVDDHFCCHFTDETGATSFLAYLAMEYSASCRKVRNPRIPIYVDIRGTKGYPALVLSMLKAGLPQVEHPVFGWTARLEDQPYLVLIDNFDPAASDHHRWLAEAYRLLPKARFVICAKAPFAMHGSKAKRKVDLPFGHRSWVLYPFDRSEVRALVRKFPLPENFNRDVIVEEIRFKFRAIGIPLTAPIICMYLTVLREKRKYAPINAAAVIENFVEQSLGKGLSAIVYQDDFDYTEQLTVLCYCAEAYVRRNIECSEYSELYALIQEYYRSRGMKRDAQAIISHFIDKTIFENYGNNIYFRYRVVFSYLLARRMGEEPTFKAFVLHEDRVYDFISELDMYTGIHRGDLATIETIENLHDRLTSEVELEFGPYVDRTSVSKIKLPRSSKMEEFVEAMQDRIDAQHSPEERDAEVEPSNERPSQFVQRFRRPDEQDILVRWAKLTACYSVTVKNSDRLDVVQKRKHLEKILNRWGMLTGLAFKVVSLLLENGKVKIGSFELNFGAGKIRNPKVVRLIVANVPQIVSQYARMYTASGKLEEIYRSVELDDFPEFLRVAGMTDLRMDEFIGEISRYHKRYRSNQTMLESLMWKMRDSFLRFGLDKVFVQPLRQQIAEFGADILGKKGADRDRHVADTIQRLGEQRLAMKLRRQDE